MRGVRPLTRVGLALVLATPIAVTTVDSAEADPGVCGYVSFTPDDTEPSSTVTVATYCNAGECNGPGVKIPHGEVGDAHYGVVVCVTGV